MFDKQKQNHPVPTPQVERFATDAVDALQKFELDVVRAKNRGDDWMDAPPQVIEYLYPNGLGTNPVNKKPMQWFWYKGQRCCIPGMSEQIEKENDMTIQDRMGDPLPGKDALVT